MNDMLNKTLILMAEDDDDYYMILQEIIKELGATALLKRFCNGEELMAYLLHQIGPQGKRAISRSIILMDLNMPKKNGHEALKEIRSIPELCKIPVIVMTISRDPQDIAKSYELGANSFITKPFDFDHSLKTFKILQEYWFETVQLSAP